MRPALTSFAVYDLAFVDLFLRFVFAFGVRAGFRDETRRALLFDASAIGCHVLPPRFGRPYITIPLVFFQVLIWINETCNFFQI